MKTNWNPWPLGIIAFFVTAIVGCVSFVVFCSLHPTDLVAADYYEQEVRYQGQMERIQNTRTFGPMSSIRYDATLRQIIIDIPPHHVAAAATGQVHLYRPSDAALDHRLPLNLDERGTQRVNGKELRPGLWNVKVLWKVGDTEYFLDQHLNIQM